MSEGAPQGGAGGPIRSDGGKGEGGGPYGKGGGRGDKGGKGGKGKGKGGGGRWGGGTGPGRGSKLDRAKNDFSQHFVDSRQRPANFIRDSNLTDRFDEYPKLKELIEAKDERIATRASPAMFKNVDLRSFDLNLLVIFRSIMTRGSIAGAAEDVGLSPSAVSHALARLRVMMNDELFFRSANGVTKGASA